MRTTERLLEDLIHQPELQQPVGGQAHGVGGHFLLVRRLFHRIDAQPSGEMTE